MNNRLLREGDVIELEVGHNVYADVPKHFLYSNYKGDFTLARGDVEIGGELAYLAGRYAVCRTATDGGGTGSTMSGASDHYPDGHHVYCERFDDPEVKVDFYQTGCFTAMIPPEDIQSVGKAVRNRWSLVKGCPCPSHDPSCTCEGCGAPGGNG